MNKIIDNPLELVKLDNNNLDDILLDNKYNKALLRQLVRECLKIIKDKDEVIEYYKKQIINQRSV